MKHKIEEEESHGGSERWLLTYSDLITLLMIFFVLMYTISNQDKQKMQQVMGSISQAFIGQKTQFVVGESPGPSAVAGKGAGQQEAQAMTQLKKQLDKYIKEAKLGTKVSVHEETRGLVVSLQEPLLFASGSAVISNEYKGVLFKIGSALKTFPNLIRVEGHTDNVPIKTNVFPSNWELSTARATNVVRFMVEQVSIGADRLAAVGYGEYRNIVPNDTELHRGTNRRVDLVLLRSEFNKVEPGAKVKDLAPVAPANAGVTDNTAVTDNTVTQKTTAP